MERPKSEPTTVVGIDVGGTKKGFHAVAIRGTSCIDKMPECDPRALLEFCSRNDAAVVGIDAPCGWRAGKERRSAERALSAAGISSFATPNENQATSAFYGWMHNGFRIYAELKKSGHRLYDGRPPSTTRLVFETFPHAIERAYCYDATAKEKRTFRRRLLESIGISTATLTNIDFIDAALCAITAQHLLSGKIRTFGDEPEEGIIVVPLIEEKRARQYWAAISAPNIP